MATFDASKRVPMGSSPFFTLPSSGARPMLPTSMGSSTSFSTGSSLPPGGYGMTASGYGSQTNTQPPPSSLVGLGGLQPLVPTSTQANNSQPRPGMPSAAAAAPVTASGASGYYQSTASAAPAVVETAVESAGASAAAAASSDDTQVMTKLQQLMNQMGTFMKSVDARLTTLEKMTGQLMNNYTEQSKTMDLRFQEITTLIQQKSSVIQLPHPAAPPAAAPFATPTPPVPPTPTLPPSQSLMSDAEVARQLQEQFDREAHLAAAAGGAGGPHGAYPALGLPPSQPNLTALQRQQMQMHRPQLPAPTPQPPASAAGKEPCPLCGAAVPPADLEAHVNQHFDEAEGIVADTLDKKNAKKQPGFWDRLFGNEDADAPPPTAQPTTPAGAAQVPARPTYPMYPPPPGAYPATQAMYPYFPGQPHQPAFGFPAR